jgi:diphosphomevalonate decarboxylase
MITATAHPNFALIKYWGKANEKLNLPAVGSILVTVDKLTTRTSVKFARNLKKDLIKLNNTKVDQRDSKRIISFLDLIRDLAGDRRFAMVNSLTTSRLRPAFLHRLPVSRHWHYRPVAPLVWI